MEMETTIFESRNKQKDCKKQLFIKNSDQLGIISTIIKINLNLDHRFESRHH
jgi:hypothetical protein